MWMISKSIRRVYVSSSYTIGCKQSFYDVCLRVSHLFGNRLLKPTLEILLRRGSWWGFDWSPADLNSTTTRPLAKQLKCRQGMSLNHHKDAVGADSCDCHLRNRRQYGS